MVVPDVITAEYGEALKKSIQELVTGPFSEYYPEVFMSYATGQGELDARGKPRNSLRCVVSK